MEFAGKAVAPKQLEMWRWLNSLGDAKERSVVQWLISADVHEHLSWAVICFGEKQSFEDFEGWIRQQGGKVPHTEGTKLYRINTRSIRANVRAVSIRYVTIRLGLDVVKGELAKYGEVLDSSRVKLSAAGGVRLATERSSIFKMELTGRQNVPSYIKVKGVTLLVTYQTRQRRARDVDQRLLKAQAIIEVSEAEGKIDCEARKGAGRWSSHQPNQ